MRRLVMVLTGLVCVLGLGLTAAASWAGVGLVSSGGPSARVGSLGGPVVVGGGPNSGK